MAIKGGSIHTADSSINGLDMVLSIAQLSKNPKAIEEFCERITEAYAISAERKAEADAATITIGQAVEATKQLSLAQDTHIQAVEKFKQDMFKRQADLVRIKSDFEDVRKHHISVHEGKLAEANQIKSDAELRNKNTDDRAAALDSRERAINEASVQIKKEYDIFTEKQKSYQDAVTRLNLKKKALTEAARNAAEGD